MIAISWEIFNGETHDVDATNRICNLTLNELILIFDKFIQFCGIDTGNLLLLSPNVRNRCNTYPMVLNSEHPWKCMQNKWYVIQDAHLNSLYLTFHPNSSTPNADGELRIGLQQHHVASIPRTALDIYLRGEYGAWPILPIEIPADRLYLRWYNTDTPSFKPYVDLVNKYFADSNKDKMNGNNNYNMWGFRMESYGLLKSSRNIYKQYDANALHKYGFKPNSLPFLVDIQTQIISLSKALSFHYILSHRNHRNRNRNRSIPIKLFSTKIFKSGWDGKTIQITDKIKVIRMKSKKTKLDKEENDNKENEDNKEDIKENKETDVIDDEKEEVKVYEIDYDDPSKTTARNLYSNPITLASNKYAVALWSSVSQNLMIPKSFKSMIEELRLPVLSALIRHLPLKQQCLFIQEKINKSDEDMEVIKNVFMIGNNILRWVLDNLMNEKKAFQQIEKIYNLCVRDMELQQQIADIGDEQKEQTEKEQKSPQKEQKESPEPLPVSDENAAAQKEDDDANKEEEETADPELEKLENALKKVFAKADEIQQDLKCEIKKACKRIQPFLHKYFSIYCEGNGVRFGFNRSNLISYNKFELHDISQHLNMWITKCLQSLLDHTPDLNICLNNFIRSFSNRIEIILQMSFNAELSLKTIQHFLCCDYYFSYCDNPIFEINNIVLQRQNECAQRVKAIEYLLQLIDCSLQCHSTYQLALTVNIPPSPLKRWCYTHGLQGVQFAYIQELKQIFAAWLSKMLSIGDNLNQFTTEKVTAQHAYRQKLIKIKSPKKSSKSKEKKEEKKEEDLNEDEEEKKIVKKKKIVRSPPKTPKAFGQEIINMSNEQFLDIYQIVLETISSAQFDANDMDLLFETKALPILFKWEALMCKCQCPIQQLHKSDFMWNAILRALHSCCEGIFQWIESENKYENDKIAAQLSTNILSQILERLHNELQFIASLHINDDAINQQITALQDLNKRKLKLSEIKRWKNKRIRTSHECILKYFQLLHRLSSFNTASNQLEFGNNRIYYSYLNLLFIILCNHHYLQHYHHRIYSLCVQKLCNLLPSLNFDSFNEIMSGNKNENKLLSFNTGETFLEFIIKSIGCYLYLETPSIPNWTSLHKTSSVLSESEKVSGYGTADNKHGTYSLILKIPTEINANSFIKYLVPKYLNQEFIDMVNKFTQVPSKPNKSGSQNEDKHRLSDMEVDVFVHEDEESNENDDESNYHSIEEEYDVDEDEVDEDEDEDEYEEEEQEEEDGHEPEPEHEHEARAFDAILAFEEFMSSAVAASKIKANILGIKSMFDAQHSTDDDETKIWLKKVNDSLNDEKSAILYTGKLKHCYSLACVLAHNGAIVYIEKSRNIADRNDNLIEINENDQQNNIIPLQSELMWNYYFMNGIIKSLIASPTWSDAINQCFNKISMDFFELFEEIDIKKERNNNSISWMNNDWCNNLVTDLDKNMENGKKLKLLFGVLVCLNNNYYGENSNVYKYLNRSNNHHHLFVGCRVRVTHLNKLQFEGLITFINTKSREITILLDNFYLKRQNKPQNTTTAKLKPFEIIRLGEHHEIEIIDFISDTKCITNHTKTVSAISLNIIQNWSNLLQKLQIVLKTWTKMNAMLAAKHQQSATLKEENGDKKETFDNEDMPKTPTQRRTTQSSSDISGLSPLQQPQRQEKEAASEQHSDPQSPKAAASEPTAAAVQSEPFVMDDSAVAMLAMAFGDEDGFDLAELQKAMALSMSVEPEQPQSQPQPQENDNIDAKEDILKPDNDSELKQDKDAKEEDDKEEDNRIIKEIKDTPKTPPTPMTPKMHIIEDNDDDKDDEKQSFPSQSFVATSRSLQAKRTQYQILFNLIQSQMLNIIHNTLLIADTNTLLHNKNMLLSFAETFISMGNTQASSSSDWQAQYENCLAMYHDLLAHNYLFNEFNRHITTILENDASKEEDGDENDKKQSQKRLTSEQMATVPYQSRYDCEDKKIIGMDGALLEFPTRWDLKFLKHFIIHPQALQIEYKENEGKSLMVTTNNKVPFVYDYYFEIKIIKIDQDIKVDQPELKDKPQNDKIGNLSIGLRSNWADFFVTNTGWKWMGKRRFLQFDTDSASNVLNTNPPKIDFFQSFIEDKLFETNNKKDDKDDKKDKKQDIISSMHETFEIGDYVDIYDESELIPVWKSAKIIDIKSDENKTIVVDILSQHRTKEFALANPKNKNIYKKLSPFASKCKNESVSIKDRDFNEATDFGLMRFGVGDYIGCGINQVDGEIYFTQNGKRFWGNKATFTNVPLFDYYPAIEIRHANIMIEANFGQKEFQFCGKNITADTDEQRSTKWKKRVSEYEEQLNTATKQILSAKRNKEELRSMAYARRLDIAESISAGGLLVGINQRQLLRGIEFNQDDANRVVDWALNQENYESAFAELGPSKSEREIEAEQQEINKKKERLCKLESIKEMLRNNEEKESDISTPIRTASSEITPTLLSPISPIFKQDINKPLPEPDYADMIDKNLMEVQFEKTKPFEHYDHIYDGVELEYGFNTLDHPTGTWTRILPIYYTQIVTDPMVEKWLNRVESRLTIHGMDRFTMIEILTRLRVNPHDMVALMQAREIDPGLDKCPIQRLSSTSSAGSLNSPMSPSKHIRRSVKQVNVTPQLLKYLKFGVCVHVKADIQSRISMIRAKIWVDQLEGIRNSVGKVVYVDTDTKPKLALVLFENENEGKQERWWLPLNVLQLAILDYNSSIILPPNKLAKLYLHNINKTCSSIAKICLQVLYNISQHVQQHQQQPAFDSIQNYQYYASLLYNPITVAMTNKSIQYEYEYVANVLNNVDKQQQREALNDIIHSILQQLNNNSFKVNLNPNNNALLIRQYAFQYKVSIGCDILIEIIKDSSRKTKNDDALTVYGDMKCTNILYRSKLHELGTIIFEQSEIWISLTGETELSLFLSPIPRLINLFICPSIRNKWNWDLILINTLIEGYFASDNIPTVIASQWMLSVANILHNLLINNQQEMIQKELELKENVKIKQAIQSWTKKLQIRLRFYYSSDIEQLQQANNNANTLSYCCLHSKLFKHIFATRLLAEKLFNITDCEATDHWYINAIDTIRNALFFQQHNKFSADFISDLCSDYLVDVREEEKISDDFANETETETAKVNVNDDKIEMKDGDKSTEETKPEPKEMNEEKEEIIKEKQQENVEKKELKELHPNKNDKLQWLGSWSKKEDILLLNIMTRYNMESRFIELYSSVGYKSMTDNSEYRLMIEKILNCIQIKLLKANKKVFSNISEYDWKLIIFYRCILLCEFNKNMASFLSLIDIDQCSPFYDLIECILPIIFFNVRQNYFNRILDYTATPSAFRQPFDLQIDRILSTDSFSFYDCVLFQAHQVLLLTDSARLRTPWSLGRGLRTETPFIIKLHDEPVEGDEGPFRAFFARLVDELQHNLYHPQQDEDEKDDAEAKDEDEEIKRVDDINYCSKNENSTPMTLALLVPTPNRSGDLGENREYFMFNPNLLYYLQAQSYYCLGRIIGISMRCSIPLHFDFPIWIWILIKNMSKYKCIRGQIEKHSNDEIDIDKHMNYLKQFDITTFQSLENIRHLNDKSSFKQLIAMLNVSDMLDANNKQEYAYNNRFDLVKDILIYQLYTRFEGQIYALICGLSEIIPLNALNVFNEIELRLKICGSSQIDLSLLKEHTVYRDGLSLNHELIKHFWEVILSLDEELKPKFIDFVYAQKRLPSKQEFIRKNLRLQISVLKVDNADQTLPQSQTCFLNLQIPQYSTKEILKRNFTKALTTASGFYKESSE